MRFRPCKFLYSKKNPSKKRFFFSFSKVPVKLYSQSTILVTVVVSIISFISIGQSTHPTPGEAPGPLSAVFLLKVKLKSVPGPLKVSPSTSAALCQRFY